MSLISKQIEELRAYAADRKGELAKMVGDAADTIESLSEKLSAANLERSSQYYNGGWIPVTERLPDEYQNYIVTDERQQSAYEYYYNPENEFTKKHGWRCSGRKIVAWMPLPEPYKGEK